MTDPSDLPHTPLDIYQLADQHDGLLLDAYGVLVNRAGALPGAQNFLDHLNQTHKPYCLITNAASRPAEQLSSLFADMGLRIPANRIISSGSLLKGCFEQQELTEKPTFVIGTEAAKDFVRQAGGRVVSCDQMEVLVVADQSGFPFLETLDQVLNQVIRRLDAGLRMPLICCNPDLIYPVTDDAFGFTAGAIAGMLEQVLHQRYGTQNELACFSYLGKPHAPIFTEGLRRLGLKSERVLMVGDQLATDILGANRVGLASCLVGTGISSAKPQSDPDLNPDYQLPSLVRHT